MNTQTHSISPFANTAFIDCWQQAHMSQASIKPLFERFVVEKKPILKQLQALSIQKLRLMGDEQDWSERPDPSLYKHLEVILQTPAWDFWKIRLQPNTPEGKQFMEQLGHKNIHTVQRPSPPELLVDMADGWEAYMAALPGRHRKEVNRKYKKAKHLSPTLYPLHQQADWTCSLEHFFNQYTQQWQQRAEQLANSSESETTPRFASETEQTLFKTWLAAEQQQGALRFYGLTLGNETIYYLLGIYRKPVFYALISIGTGIYQEFSPVILAYSLILESLAEEGCRLVELGPGKFQHKSLFATGEEEVSSVFIARPGSVIGRLAVTSLNWLKDPR